MTQPMPNDYIKRRLMRSLEATPALSRASETTRTTVVMASAWILSFAIYCGMGGVRQTGRPLALIFGTAFGTCAVALLGVYLLTGRDRKMSGRPRSLLVALVILLPLTLLAWKVGYSAQFAHALDRSVTRIGYRCLGLGLTVGVTPLLALLYARRGTDPSHPATAGLALGVSVGLIAATLVDLWCPVAYVPHLLLGHLLPIAILGVVGLLVGRRLLA